MTTPDDEVDPEELLRRLFSGRRRFPRRPQRLSALVTFLDKEWGDYLARSVDVSRGGVLLAITDPRFALAEGFALAAAADGAEADSGGAVVTFTDKKMRIRASVVRLVLVEEARVALGLRFEHTLTEEQARLLHLPVQSGDDVPKTPDRAAASHAAPDSRAPSHSPR